MAQQLPARVTTGDGILHELYAVSAEYQITLARLRTAGTSEDIMTDELYRSSLKAYLLPLSVDGMWPDLSDETRRQMLVNLACLALRWAKTMRPA